MPIERSISVTTHGHYLEEGAAGGTGVGVGVLVSFHGYGETAKDGLVALQGIPGAGRWTCCAVQGLHAFYRQRTGEVVASWMTRFQRDLAIRDNVAYGAAVLGELEERHGSGGPRVLAGFSQGVAMAYRTAAFSGCRVDGLIVLAGDVPPDLSDSDLSGLPPILLGQGSEDKWYTAAKLDADLARLEAAGARVEACRFSGGHEWAAPFLEAAGAFLDRLGP